MGTRNLTLVKLNGENKVAQYGQWDGYPTGQGGTIAEFLETIKSDEALEAFKAEVAKIHDITDEEKELLDKDPNWKVNFPYMSRDAGAEILNMIREGTVKFVFRDEAFKDDGLFCEYYYEVDLDNKTVQMNGGKVFTFDEWTKDLMKILENTDEE